MSRLNWDDLLIQDITPAQFRDWFAPWAGLVTGQVAFAFMSKFGFWFLHREEGHVEMLDVFTGLVKRMADSCDQFLCDVNEPWWHEAYLFSELVYQLHQDGKIPGKDQCYALAPHPALGGPNPARGDPINSRFVMLADVLVWQSICAQSLA